MKVRSQEPTGQSPAYIPGLDGVRGIAILAVVIYHVPNAPHGYSVASVVGHAANLGWIGVDLFFVLSGFLITGILIDARGKEGYFRTFYLRRILRIVPVYVVFLCFCMWIAPHIGVLPSETSRQLRATQGWYWSYTINVFLAVRGWTAGGDGPSHLWSLAVEEQFYLLWPLVVLLARPGTLPKISLGCIIAAELCRVAFVFWSPDPRVNYLLLPTRMDTLATGAFLASAVRDPALLALVNRWKTRVVAISVGALFVVLAYSHTLDFQHTVDQLVAFPAIALVSGALVLIARRSPPPLAAPTLRFLGRYSYGMYVWHWLVLVFLARQTALFKSPAGSIISLSRYALAVAVVLALTVAVALVSWYCIEQPFLRLKRYVPYATKVAHAGLS